MRRALAAARLSAERDLLQGDAAELTVLEEHAAEQGGAIAVTLVLRLVLAVSY